VDERPRHQGQSLLTHHGNAISGNPHIYRDFGRIEVMGIISVSTIELIVQGEVLKTKIMDGCYD